MYDQQFCIGVKYIVSERKGDAHFIEDCEIHGECNMWSTALGSMIEKEL